jgi:hypothetical protein
LGPIRQSRQEMAKHFTFFIHLSHLNSDQFAAWRLVKL